jgi:predicted Zn-dependent protease
MKTLNSFTFQARRYVPPHMESCNSIESYCSSSWYMSAGRWESHKEAAEAAAKWLVARASEDNWQYELAIIQVEELELD